MNRLSSMSQLLSLSFRIRILQSLYWLLEVPCGMKIRSLEMTLRWVSRFWFLPSIVLQYTTVVSIHTAECQPITGVYTAALDLFSPMTTIRGKENSGFQRSNRPCSCVPWRRYPPWHCMFKALALGASRVFVLSPGERETDYKFTAGFDVRKKFGENDKWDIY